ncbi:PAS domain-containing protein [Halovenus sp. WSH3]|uniref:histidine kinase n=1 Tax=Halovenus carboxidivorans TaxID=2692199 RepID=A0A6B0TDE9_9EURY|nr:ATP-binding protein [Halovenus carboxidivorans]MXR52950.1 PAS domain-containing protein [Halovenus carboxidivorans]
MATPPVVIDTLGVVTGLSALVVAAYTLRYRGRPVANAFVGAALALVLWGGLMIVPGTFGIPTDGTGVGWRLFRLLRFVLGATAPILFYVYVRLYTGYTQYSEWQTLGRLFAPVAVLGVVRVWGASFVTEEMGIATAVLGVVVTGFYLYVLGLLLLGAYRLARLAKRYKQMPATQAGALCLGMVSPYVIVFVNGLTEPTESGGTVSILPVDITFVGVAIAGGAIAFAVRSYPLFRPLPDAEYIARDEVIENLAEGVIVLDRDDRIIDLNERAERICEDSTESVIGKPIQTISETLAAVPTGATRRIDLQTPEGSRRFEVTTSAVRSGEDEPAGKTLRLRDVTEQQTREQQLQVLTRVLRHNLRNELDAALAYTNEVDDERISTQLRERVNRLVEISDKARDVEDVLSRGTESRSIVDLTQTITDAASRIESEYEHCQLTVSTPETVRVFGHPELLDRLVSELIENGIEHNDSPSPAVEVTVTTAADRTVEIEIRDNGPGIPEHERSVIESGAETELRHSTGLGLWLANWIADSLAGELLFPESESGGVVIVRLYSALVERADHPVDGITGATETDSAEPETDEQQIPAE